MSFLSLITKINFIFLTFVIFYECLLGQSENQEDLAYEKSINIYKDELKKTFDKNKKGQILLKIGECFFKIGEYEKAVKVFNNALILPLDENKKNEIIGKIKLINEVINYLKYAKENFDKKNYETSLQYYKKALNLDKNSPIAQKGYQEAKYRIEKEKDEAIELVKDIIDERKIIRIVKENSPRVIWLYKDVELGGPGIGVPFQPELLYDVVYNAKKISFRRYEVSIILIPKSNSRDILKMLYYSQYNPGTLEYLRERQPQFFKIVEGLLSEYRLKRLYICSFISDLEKNSVTANDSFSINYWYWIKK